MSRQLAMVIDLNKCMGCQTCSVSCKVLYTDKKGMEHQWWVKTNTMPGRGYPRDWASMGGGYDADGRVVLGRRPSTDDYEGDWRFRPWEVYTSGGRGTDAHQQIDGSRWGPNYDEDLGAGAWPNGYFFYLPRMCNQCSRPACGDACARGAITKRQDDGVVAIDEEKCRDCSEPRCINACPYKEMFWNPVRKAAQKCDFCLPRLEREVAPACLRACPGRSIWIDYLDNRDGIVHKLVHGYRVALPLRGDWGTGPNIYYVPPMSPPRLKEDQDGLLEVDEGTPRLPLEYLESLFGTSVHQALDTLKGEIDKQRRGERSDLMWLLISPRSHAFFGPFAKDLSEVGQS